MMIRFGWSAIACCLLLSGCRRPPDRCSGVSCSGHGTCVVVRGEPTCACDPGYGPQGLNCLAVGEAASPAAASLSDPAAVEEGAAPAGTPPEASPPAVEAATDGRRERLCGLALAALARPETGGPPELATAAKREAIGRSGAAIAAGCVEFLRRIAPGEQPLSCATTALEEAAAQGIDLGALAAADPAAASCGEVWKRVISSNTEAFRALLAAQRESFGVAVFGFHRVYGFAGGALEETCRRFLGAVPDSPPDLLRAGAGLSDEWAARLRSCGETTGHPGVGPLARWCVVDRAEEILRTGTAEACARYVGEEERPALAELVGALRALVP